MTDNGKTTVSEMDRQQLTQLITAEVEDFNVTEGTSLTLAWSEDGGEAVIEGFPTEEHYEVLEENFYMNQLSRKDIKENAQHEMVITLS